jgi:hypothetical protein
MFGKCGGRDRFAANEYFPHAVIVDPATDRFTETDAGANKFRRVATLTSMSLRRG